MFTAVLLMIVTCTLLGGLGGDNDSVVNSPLSLLLPLPYPFSATTWYWYRVLGRRCISRIMDWLVVTVNYSKDVRSYNVLHELTHTYMYYTAQHKSLMVENFDKQLTIHHSFPTNLFLLTFND